LATDFEKAILERLDQLVRLSASLLVEGRSSSDAIRDLGQLGLDRKQISEVTNASTATVSVRLSEAKREKKKKKSK